VDLCPPDARFVMQHAGSWGKMLSQVNSTTHATERGAPNRKLSCGVLLSLSLAGLHGGITESGFSTIFGWRKLKGRMTHSLRCYLENSGSFVFCYFVCLLLYTNIAVACLCMVLYPCVWRCMALYDVVCLCMPVYATRELRSNPTRKANTGLQRLTQAYTGF